MLSIKDKIMHQSPLDRYINEPNALTLLSNINHSTTPADIIQSFYIHSSLVHSEQVAPDYLNGCDGDTSPLSIFIYELLKGENLFYFSEIIEQIQTEDDYRKWKWILDEFNCLAWTDPVNHLTHIELFIIHPIIGRHFSFFGGCWISNEYYIQRGFNLHVIDEVYMHFIKLYSDIHLRLRYKYTNTNREIGNETKRRKINHTNEEERAFRKEVKKDLVFREVSLPGVEAYLAK